MLREHSELEAIGAIVDRMAVGEKIGKSAKVSHEEREKEWRMRKAEIVAGIMLRKSMLIGDEVNRRLLPLYQARDKYNREALERAVEFVNAFRNGATPSWSMMFEGSGTLKRETNAKGELAPVYDPTNKNGNGTGKTWLAQAITVEVCKLGRCAVFVPETKLMQIFQGAEIGNGDYSKQQVIEQFVVKPDLLVIDDLGTGKDGDFRNRKMFEILDLRSERMEKPIVFTSNMDYIDLVESYTNRVADRIKGACARPDGKRAWYRLTGPSRR